MGWPTLFRAPMAAAAEAPDRPRTILIAGALAVLLSGCASVDWVRTRFVEPRPVTTVPPPVTTAPAPAPAPATPLPAAAPPAAALPPASQRGLQPVRRRAEAAAPAAAVAEAAPIAPAIAAAPPAPPAAPTPNRAVPAAAAPPPAAPAAPAAAPAPAPSAPKAGAPAAPAAAPRATAQPPAARPLTAPVPPRAEADLAPGRFAVQVAAFMTPASAEAQRNRIVTRLRAAARPEADATRVLKVGGRYFVLVGDFAERAQAEAAAEQLRATLRQDLLIFRR